MRDARLTTGSVLDRAVASVTEYFRDDVEGELPSDRASPLLARVTALDWACDASPEGYARAIDALAAGLDDIRSAAQRMRTNPPISQRLNARLGRLALKSGAE